jgi:hypothetical protein
MPRKKHSFLFLIAALGIFSILPKVTCASSAAGEREAVTKIVLQVQKADYDGDRAALQRLYGELAPLRTKRNLLPSAILARLCPLA